MKWTTIAELLILVISAGLGIRQLVLLRTQMRDQHEEHRRENTMNIMTTWCNSLNKDTCIAEEVARELNHDQCKKLYNHEPFSIDSNIRDSLCKFCPLDKADCENCSARTKNEVDGKILTELRWHVITYLNMLETVMVSWDLGVVDKEMIEEQFLFIKKGQALSQFRQSAGGYPTIEKFLRKISPAAESKKPL